MDYTAELDRLIEAPVYVIDFFPEQVPACYGERFWKVEEMIFLQAGIPPALPEIPAHPAEAKLLLRFHREPWAGLEENPSPKRLEQLVESSSHGRKDTLNILVDQSRAMIILTGITSI